MNFVEEITRRLSNLDQATTGSSELAGRLKGELDFARNLAESFPDQQADWQALVLKAADAALAAFSRGESPNAALKAAETILEPLAKTAKEFTIHCAGHAHIDMNWLWSWPETIATTNDTFTTMDKLMDEFPEFKFSQSQASVYQIAKDYLPELYQKMKKRVAKGRWEVTAALWVEGDKNMASGEILCRHLLYTKRFFKQEFGMPYDSVKIDWEPDTFGHMHTLPSILNKAGITRYYFHRSAEGPEMFWWQGKDGSRVLAFDDRRRGYNGRFSENLHGRITDFYKETGVKDYLFVYGVGDHGGGPTRRDLVRALDMNTWPIYPNVKLSTVDAFFTAAEKQVRADLPVVDSEMNYIFEGCYTSQSLIKRANRISENALVEAEIAALLGRGLARIPYPAEALNTGWRHAMFNQFHDILPGSGIHVTYEHASGLFQEILAQTTMVKTRALRAVAAQVNTAKSCLCDASQATGAGSGVGPGIGGGPGDYPREGAITRRGYGSPCCDPFVVFNPSPWKRSELVSVRIWDQKHPSDQIAVKDDQGNVIAGQVVERGGYWGHDFIGVAFPAKDVGGLGYRSFSIGRLAEVPKQEGVAVGDSKGTIENEFFKVQVDQLSGSIEHLIDKRTGLDLVPPGQKLGFLEYLLEAPHPMTAWVMGQIVKRVPQTGATLDYAQNGPYLAQIKSRYKFNDSKFTLAISVAAGVPRIDFTLDVDWLERGSPEIGVPMLRAVFPLAIAEPVGTFECANGHVTRPTDPRQFKCFTASVGYWRSEEAVDRVPGEVPAQKWMDLTGKQAEQSVGASLLNDSKYGHNLNGSTMALTLLRSSYDPDPLPELGHHTIRFALVPHAGDWTASDSTRAGYGFNFPFNAVGTGMQEGKLPAKKTFGEILTPNVMLSGMKKAEDSSAVIVRLYEMEGRATTARMKLDEALVPASAQAVETDILEQPLAKNTAKFERGTLSVKIAPFSLVTVRLK